MNDTNESKIINTVKDNNTHYYMESVEETPYIIANIKNSQNQTLYKDYLSKYRDIQKSTLDEAHMFYILDGGEELDEILPLMYFRELLGIQTGDFMRQKERFVFPIMDQLETIIGFVGYDYDETTYKYLMTFAKFAEKENVFFNMQHLSKAYKEDVCIIEEGIFDSLRLNETGLYNNLGLMGKRLTEFHKRLLSRFSLVIIIADNDEVGIKASASWEKDLLGDRYNNPFGKNFKKSNNTQISNNPFGSFSNQAGNNLFGSSKDFNTTSTSGTRVATIYLNRTGFEKRTINTETQDEIIIQSEIKDIDNYLSVQENKIKFRQLYNRILKDFENPLLTSKKYTI